MASLIDTLIDVLGQEDAEYKKLIVAGEPLSKKEQKELEKDANKKQLGG